MQTVFVSAVTLSDVGELWELRVFHKKTQKLRKHKGAHSPAYEHTDTTGIC